MSINRQIRLKSRPAGTPTAENFELAEAPMPRAGDGEVLRRTIYLSLDPYMRGRMSDAPSYAAPVELGDVMCGHTVSEVVESRNPDFRAGDIVAGYDGWQEYGLSNGKELRKLDRERPADLDRDRRARHAGHDGVRRAARHRPAEAGRDGRRVRRLRRGRRRRRSAREDQGLPRGRHRRARPTSAATSSTSSASTPASTTRPTIWCRRCGRRVRTASTSTSRTSAARCSRRCCACSTAARAFRCAG